MSKFLPLPSVRLVDEAIVDHVGNMASFDVAWDVRDTARALARLRGAAKACMAGDGSGALAGMGAWYCRACAGAGAAAVPIGEATVGGAGPCARGSEGCGCWVHAWAVSSDGSPCDCVAGSHTIPVVCEFFTHACKRLPRRAAGVANECWTKCSPHCWPQDGARDRTCKIVADRTGRGTELRKTLETCSTVHFGSEFGAPGANFDKNWPTCDQICPDQTWPKIGPIRDEVGQTLAVVFRN